MADPFPKALPERPMLVVGQNHVLEQLESLLYLKVWGKSRVSRFRKILFQVKL